MDSISCEAFLQGTTKGNNTEFPSNKPNPIKEVMSL